MFRIKSSAEIETMREGGKISRKILDEALRMCLPGTVLIDIDDQIGKLLKHYDVESWFKEVNNYPRNSCISVNEVWIHGIPDNTILNEGDVVSIDIGIKYKGFYLDNCWTITVSPENSNIKEIRSAFSHNDNQVQDFLQAGADALDLAINNFKLGNRTGDISASMQEVEQSGYSVIREFTGHGVGYTPHEDPPIPCYGTYGAGLKVKKNMVLAIEIMYTMGGFEIETAKDGWGIITKDRSLSAMFEHTVALTEDGPEILTK